MKKLLVMLVVMAIAAPMYAADVDFAATDNGDGTCTITYTVNAGTIRGMALNVDADGPLSGATVDSFFDVFMDAAYMDPDNYVLGAGTPIATQDAAGEEAISGNFCLSMGNLEGVATANEIVLSADAAVAGTLSVNTLRGAVVNTDGVEMTTNLPIDFTITIGDGCTCPGDVTASVGFGDPDGIVDTGDLLGIITQLSIAGAPYIISPTPAGMECGDVTSSVGFGDPDGQLDTGDLLGIITYLSGLGAPYSGGCM